MNYLRQILAPLTVFILSVASAQAGDLGTQIATQSRYYGVGWQNDGNHWSIELLLGEKSGQVAYPSADCSGDWTLIENNNQQVQYIEKITEGLEDCIEFGTVTITALPENRLLYTWREHPTQIVARAVLAPVSEIRLNYMELLLLTLNGVELDYMLPEFAE